MQNLPQNVHPSKERYKWFKQNKTKQNYTAQQRDYKGRGNRTWKKRSEDSEETSRNYTLPKTLSEAPWKLGM